MNASEARRKSAIAVSVFAIFFAGIASYSVSDWRTALPLAIFYLALLINTYFSVKLFSQIIPKSDTLQNVTDAVLVLFYFGLPLALETPLLFYFLSSVFFICSCMKYVFLLGTIAQPKLLKRKILLNLLGALGCLVTFGTAVAGYQSVSWIFASAFCIGHVIVLFVRPMYRLD